MRSGLSLCYTVAQADTHGQAKAQHAITESTAVADAPVKFDRILPPARSRRRSMASVGSVGSAGSLHYQIDEMDAWDIESHHSLRLAPDTIDVCNDEWAQTEIAELRSSLQAAEALAFAAELTSRKVHAENETFQKSNLLLRETVDRLQDKLKAFLKIGCVFSILLCLL